MKEVCPLPGQRPLNDCITLWDAWLCTYTHALLKQSGVTQKGNWEGDILEILLSDHIGVGLFLGSLFYFFDLYVCFYASTMLFWLLRTCTPKKKKIFRNKFNYWNKRSVLRKLQDIEERNQRRYKSVEACTVFMDTKN